MTNKTRIPSLFGRRQVLQGGSVGLATLFTSVPWRSKGAESDINGRIIGLTTLDENGASWRRSELLSLDLASGEMRMSSLGRYRVGHSLIRLPGGGYFAVPYGDDRDPCLFLDEDFQVMDRLFAPEGHGFGGHALLLPDNKTLFTHFNYEGGEQGANDTGTIALVDIATRQVVHRAPSAILHAHHIILSRDGTTVILSDDGDILTPFPENSPYSVIPYRPSLHLFNANNAEFMRTVDLRTNGGFVHIEEGMDGRIYGGIEQFVFRNEVGIRELRKQLGGETDAFVARFDPEAFPEEIPLPGPLVGMDLASGQVTSSMSLDHLDPFDIRLNQATGLLLCVYTTSNMLARYDWDAAAWTYFSTGAFGINEPYGLIEIPGTSLMALNGYRRGIAVFDVRTMNLERYFDVPTHGLKHMLKI